VPDDIQRQAEAAARLKLSPTLDKSQAEQWANETTRVVGERWGLSSLNHLQFREYIARSTTGDSALNLEIWLTKLQSFGPPPWPK
jgi:hypothetical protein